MGRDELISSYSGLWIDLAFLIIVIAIVLGRLLWLRRKKQIRKSHPTAINPRARYERSWDPHKRSYHE